MVSTLRHYTLDSATVRVHPYTVHREQSTDVLYFVLGPYTRYSTAVNTTRRQLHIVSYRLSARTVPGFGVSQRFIGALRRVAARLPTQHTSHRASHTSGSTVLGSWVECCFYSSDSKVTYTRRCAA
jgi:hypothetical protein